MRIAVTDACIFIDLIELGVISEFFKLQVEFHTTVDVVNELFPEHKQILMAYQSGNKLTIHNLGSQAIKEMQLISFPIGLSQEDRTIIYLALQWDCAILLSSDKLIQEFADEQSLNSQGLFWVFDKLVDKGILSKEVATSKIKKILTTNMIYTTTAMKKEADKRISKWLSK